MEIDTNDSQYIGFDYHAYYTRYPDIARAFYLYRRKRDKNIPAKLFAWKHYILYGKEEGRQVEFKFNTPSLEEEDDEGEKTEQFVITSKETFREACMRELPHARSIIIPKAVKKEPRLETVLIEFRWFPHLEFLVRNMVIKLHHWNHTIVCGNKNFQEIKTMCKSICPDIRIIRMDIDNLVPSTYSELLMTKPFWEQFHGEKLLIYQEDSFLFHEHIEPFLDYDYVGAPWPKHQDDNKLCVGNGGFSLRTKTVMIKVIENVKMESLKLGKNTIEYMKNTNSFVVPEDVYFTKAMIDFKMGWVASWDIARKFSQESIPSDNPVGGHNFFLANHLHNDLHIGELHSHDFQSLMKRIKFSPHYHEQYVEKLKKNYLHYQLTHIEYLSLGKEPEIKKYEKKTGIVCTTHGKMGIYVKQAIQSFLKFMPENTYIIVYVNESTDPITLQLKELFPSIDVVFINDQNKNGGLTATWNRGIQKCLDNHCDNVILSNDDVFVLSDIHYILQELEKCDKEMKYFGPLTNNPGPNNQIQYSLSSQDKHPFKCIQNKAMWNLNGFFMAFPKHVLMRNKYDKKHYFDPKYPFAKNETEWFQRFSKKGGQSIVVPKTFVYHYKLASWRKNQKKNNVCMYSAVLGGYEDLIYLHSNTDFDIFYFTDCINSIYDCIRKNIKPMLVFDSSNTILTQRSIKTCPQKYLPSNFETSIWIDGNLLSFISSIDEYDIQNNDLICFQHPERTNIEEEWEQVVQHGLISAEVGNKMKLLYAKNQYEPAKHNQLHETCILIRKHNTAILQMNEEWERCIELCHRDQLSFDFLLWNLNINFQSIDIKNRPVVKCSHSRRGTHVIRYSMK